MNVESCKAEHSTGDLGMREAGKCFSLKVFHPVRMLFCAFLMKVVVYWLHGAWNTVDTN